MDAAIDRPSTSRLVLWISYVISAIPVLMMVMSGIMKFIPSQALNEGFDHLGWPIGQASMLAIIELGCVIIYLIPRTAILGAILVTGYLGGATATHVRVTDVQFFIPTLLGVLAWFGLWLREPRLKPLLPFRS